LLGQEFVEVSVLTPRPSPLAHPGVQDRLIVLLRTETGVECLDNAQYGYDIRCEVVGATGTAALPLHGADLPPGFQERFATAYARELESWASGAPAGASAWDGYAASVVCEAAVGRCAPAGRPRST
jgi:myo-inositol 2-dehydrogenase/D-chiro-inositol 1-dehydrogenase